MTHKGTWKKCERDIASHIASKRTPLSGSNSGHSTNSDTLNKYLYIEAKYRSQHYAVQLYFDELPKARAEGKPLIIALKQKGQSDPPYLYLVDPRDIEQICSLIKQSKRENPDLWKRMQKTPS